MSDQALPHEIRGVQVPITGGRMLLPNASVAEVITMPTAEAVEGAPAWLLGRIGWRGWRLPMFSFSIMIGLAEEELALNSRVAVIKALGGNERMPYLALVTQGFPRLTTLSQDIVVPIDDGTSAPLGVMQRVMLRDDEAIVPDLDAIEVQVNAALEAAKAA